MHDKRILCLLVLITLGIASCSNPTSNPTVIAPATLTKVGWIVENIDSTFWSGTAPSGHLFYDFTLYYNGNLSVSDISSARVYLANGNYWTLNPSSYLNTSTQSIGGYTRFYLTANGNQLPTGSLRAVLIFANGTSSALNFYTHEPGSTTYTYGQVKSEDDLVTANCAAALKRPTVTSAVKSSTLLVTFSLNDSNFYNGWVWLYDSSRNYLGRSPYFRSTSTGVVTSYVNSNSGILYNSGTSNTVTFALNDITPAAGTNLSSLTNVYSCILVAQDGSQYACSGNFNNYDYRALSSLKIFN